MKSVFNTYYVSCTNQIIVYPTQIGGGAGLTSGGGAGFVGGGAG